MKMMDFVKHWRQWRIYSLPVLIMFSLVVVSMRRPEQGHSIPLENFIPVENADPKREIFQKMKVSQCGCSKLVPTNEIPPNPIWDQGNTTCSLDTWIRGPHQGVIGFTYFEHPAKTDKAKSRDYLQGVQDNLELMKEYYPGFVMRLFSQSLTRVEHAQIIL
ncbi:uncharacterized protein LOC131882602 [Tigriopus californicus]|uniref:uncharacterized protein LOC131882602 n=1 Tax=Tigriopus californicus TaxID=6832 RepID=UPI0027DA34A0|nr:uncharacterized protein LOC131882602 [Tigriopus californicus]